MFAGVGVLAAQLAATRRQANGIAAAIFGASLLIRVVADSTPGRHWLRWLSPSAGPRISTRLPARRR